MKRLLLLFLLNASLFFAQEKVTVSDLVKLKFDNQFPNSLNERWSKFYRGYDNEEVRYEVDFDFNSKHYLVSYDKNAVIKAIQESVAITDLLSTIKEFIHSQYAGFSINKASKVTEEEGKVFYNVGIATEKDYLVLVFNHEGYYLYKSILK